MIDENKVLPESEICEWKSSWHDKYMKWLSAFAWNDGGTLHIGVNDDGYVIPIPGWCSEEYCVERYQ